jgi:hypothetical protein
VVIILLSLPGVSEADAIKDTIKLAVDERKHSFRSRSNIFPLLCRFPRFLYLSPAHSLLWTVGVQKNTNHLRHVSNQVFTR